MTFKFRPVSDEQRGFVMDDTNRVVVALGGRGSGKTHVGVAKCLRHVIEYPGARVWFVGPDLERIEEGLLDKFRELCPPDLLVEEAISRKTFRLANGASIRWRSTDARAGLRAGEKSLAVFDEAAWSPYAQARAAYSDLRANLRMYKREFWCPNEWIFDHPRIRVIERQRDRSFIEVEYKSQLLITTTPALRSFINDLLDAPPRGCKIYHLRTEDNLEHLRPDYIEELHEAYGYDSLFQQEAMGELVTVASPDYPDFDRKYHIMSHPGDMRAFKVVAGGIDWGWRSALAIVIVGFTSSGTAFGLEEWGGSHIDLDKVVLKAGELMRKWGVHVYFCDQQEPANISFLNRQGVPAVKQAVIDKAYRVAAVSSRFKKTQAGTYRLYLDPSMTETVRELRMGGMEVEDPRTVKEIKSGQPQDDFVDALEYAVTGGERLFGSPFLPVEGRGQKRHEGRPAMAISWRLLG